MSSGNWGGFSHVRSTGSRRRRVILSILSVVAGVAVVGLADRFDGGSDITAEALGIAALLVAGIVFGLRPWAR